MIHLEYIKVGKSGGKGGKVVKSWKKGEKWEKVGKSGEKLEKVGKRREKLGKEEKVAKSCFMWFYVTKSGFTRLNAVKNT